MLPYESLPSLTAADSALDTVTSLLWAAPRDRQPLMRSLVTNLGKSSFLVGKIIEKCMQLHTAYSIHVLYYQYLLNHIQMFLLENIKCDSIICIRFLHTTMAIGNA